MVRTGLENFIDNIDKYKKRNIALIANHTSITNNFEYSWNIFKKHGLKLKRIFSPEHGLFGIEQDQVPVKIQPLLNTEIVSLYGDSYSTLIPHKSCLEGIDLVIFDIQDVGARYYTYVNTMAMFFQIISGMDIEFLVLDRPNPLGGNSVEGPLLKKGYESFVGVMPVCVRHGLTAGEFAKMVVHEFKVDVNLSIEEMDGWHRDMLFNHTGLKWVPPSPNMPTVNTVNVYPGICLFEGLNISEGRGTTTPFEVLGAPFIEPEEFTMYLNLLEVGGVIFRPLYFKPTFHKYSDEIIGGIHIHVTDTEAFKPFFTGIVITKAIYDLYDSLEFLEDVYEFNTTHPIFDLLTGSSKVREMIIEGRDIENICELWHDDEKNYLEEKEKYHIYKVKNET
ncbi:exo-beta-N-acetylmuramidase NamZ domain-containing protein [Spirochaetota bacterium]